MSPSTLVKRWELQSSGRCKSRQTRKNRGPEAASDGEVSLECILEKLVSTPQTKVLKRIASLPNIRRGKVLNIRRRIRKGAYSVEDRLERVTDQVLTAVTT